MYYCCRIENRLDPDPLPDRVLPRSSSAPNAPTEPSAFQPNPTAFHRRKRSSLISIARSQPPKARIHQVGGTWQRWCHQLGSKSLGIRAAVLNSKSLWTVNIISATPECRTNHHQKTKTVQLRGRSHPPATSDSHLPAAQRCPGRRYRG